ncbi:fimbria/pilus periplasmic chaperone [Enterobacter roggenkampii]|uniref:fimbria/pilus periplasmic chaperone n=1 Tax=Enterobacter roggenkampii TaxID=1812935 RepID=UPI001237B28A|nr:fimbria/pilus periplasmic chaperone [Enterobacter roggenkampii]
MKSVITRSISPLSLFTLTVLSLGCINASYAAGVALNATRIIYPENAKQASINVTNSSRKESYLVQSWVSDHNGAKVSSFIVTPPLFMLKPGKTNILRIMYAGPALPADKESVFYLNNKAIPSVEKTDHPTNTLQIATQSVIKLFVRPQHLSVKPTDAPAMLRCQFQNNGLTIANPSPYYVTLVNFTVDGKKQPNTMVPPLGNETVRVSGASKGAVSYQTLNDYGAITPVLACKA